MKVYVIVCYKGAGDGKVRMHNIVSVYKDGPFANAVCEDLNKTAGVLGVDKLYDVETWEVE